MPRFSPPAASPAVRAARNRSASLPDDPRKVSAMASGTPGLVRMLPWAAKPSPMTLPACSKHSSPVYEALAPSAATIPTCRWLRSASCPSEDRWCPLARAPIPAIQPAAPVGDFGVRLSGHGPDPSPSPRHEGADGEELRLHRHTTLPCLGIGTHDRIRRRTVVVGPHHAKLPRTSVDRLLDDTCRFGRRPFVVRMNGDEQERRSAHGHRSQPQPRY